MRKVSGIMADTTELRKLILEHPDYPIAVLCSGDVNTGDYSWMYASDITFAKGELLDYDQKINDEKTYIDRADFYQDLEEWLYEYLCYEISENGMYDDREPTEEQFQKKLALEKAKYEPHWKKCIFIYADN